MAKKKVTSGQPTLDSFGSVPTMPEGYYSGDQPNQNLRTFIEAHGTPYDPAKDDYAAAAFSEPITSTKASAIYNMHTYWSKKPHDAIQRYIRHYTNPGDIILDPFCGSGSTALASLLENRCAIAIDRSPAATFITRTYCTPVAINNVKAALSNLQAQVSPEMNRLYETRCEKCGGKATTVYTVYSIVFQCPRCLTKLPLHDCTLLDGKTAGGKRQKFNACPFCLTKGHTEVIRTQSQKFGYMPVMVRYHCLQNCKPARASRYYNDSDKEKAECFKKYDLAKIGDIEAKSIPYPYPQGYKMTHFSRYQRDALRLYDVEEVADLFTKRNLWALALLRFHLSKIARPDSSADASVIWAALTTVSLTGTRMLREEKRAIQAGVYYMPAVFREIKIWTGIEYNVFQLLKAKERVNSLMPDSPRLMISTQSACKVQNIPSASIDYIFTDPPYADKVQYGELNFVWEAWLDLDTTWHDQEIIVNEVRGKDEAEWASLMKQAMAECYRVLKPGRWMSLCYHDTSEGTWELIQDIMAEVGFVVDKTASTLFIDTGQKSYNQVTADKSTKRDLVLNFRKPKPGEWRIRAYVPGSFHDSARSVIRDFLTAHPGSTKDRVPGGRAGLSVLARCKR